MRILPAFFITASLLCAAPIASAKIAPSADYARLPAIYDASISPNGKWMAAVVDNKGSYIVRVYNLENLGEKKTRATSIGSKVRVEWLDWANNDQLLVSISQFQKKGSVIYKTGSLLVMDKDMKHIRPVLKAKAKQKGATRFNDDVSYRQFNNDVVDLLLDEPNYILMSFGEKNQFEPGVHKVSLKNSGHKKVKNGSSSTQNWITDLRGEVRVGKGRTEHSGDYNMSIRSADRRGANAWQGANSYPGLNTQTRVFGFMENPNEMIVGARNGKNTIGLYVYDLVQKRQTRKLLHDDAYDVGGIIKSPDGKKVVGAYYVGGAKQAVFFDSAYKARFKSVQAQLPEYDIRYIDQTIDGNKILFKASTSSVPSALYLYDFTAKKLQKLGEDYPEVSKKLQGDVTKVRYTARDGYKIPGYITTPPKVADGAVPFKNLPFIILPHGGPYARDTHSFDYLAQYFVSRGYAVLQPNYRGSAGFGQAHLEAGRKNWVVMQEDVEDGVRWLIKKGYADPKRVCIAGWSYGGYAALMGAIKNPELYACSISIAGLTDPQAHVHDREKFRFGKHNAKSFILHGFEGRDDIKMNSPVKRAGEMKTPVFLAHGTRDSQVNVNQYRRMKSALKASGAPKIFLEFEGGDHSLMNFGHRKELFSSLDTFLAKHLGKSNAAP